MSFLRFIFLQSPNGCCCMSRNRHYWFRNHSQSAKAQKQNITNYVRRGSEAVALAVWVRVLLPQILGSSPAALPSAAAQPGKGGIAAAGGAAQPQQQQQQPQPQQQLSEASAVKAFGYLDGLLGSPAMKRNMHRGVVVGPDQAPAPLVPPAPLLALLQAVHQPGRLQGDTAVLARSHQVLLGPSDAGHCTSTQHADEPNRLINSRQTVRRLAGLISAIMCLYRMQSILRTIALSGAPDGGFDTAELLRLALDGAAVAEGGADDPLVQSCAQLVVEVLPLLTASLHRL